MLKEIYIFLRRLYKLSECNIILYSSLPTPFLPKEVQREVAVQLVAAHDGLVLPDADRLEELLREHGDDDVLGSERARVDLEDGVVEGAVPVEGALGFKDLFVLLCHREVRREGTNLPPTLVDVSFHGTPPLLGLLDGVFDGDESPFSLLVVLAERGLDVGEHDFSGGSTMQNNMEEKETEEQGQILVSGSLSPRNMIS